MSSKINFTFRCFLLKSDRSGCPNSDRSLSWPPSRPRRGRVQDRYIARSFRSPLGRALACCFPVYQFGRHLLLRSVTQFRMLLLLFMVCGILYIGGRIDACHVRYIHEFRSSGLHSRPNLSGSHRVMRLHQLTDVSQGDSETA